MKEKITGIILAGGKSRRMGTDKAFVMFNGKKFIEYSIALAREFCDQILISANDEKYLQFGHSVISDIIPNHGPIGGIYSCLENSRNNFNFVISCDTPFISIELIRYILKNVENHQIVAPTTGEELYEPLCAFYHKNSIPIIRQFINANNNKIPDIFKAVDFKAITIDNSLSFWQPNLFANINTVNEFNRYC